MNGTGPLTSKHIAKKAECIEKHLRNKQGQGLGIRAQLTHDIKGRAK